MPDPPKAALASGLWSGDIQSSMEKIAPAFWSLLNTGDNG